MFNSNKIRRAYQLPAVVHVFGTDKERFGRLLNELINRGLEPMATAILGTNALPPVWQSADGNNFAVGNTLRCAAAKGSLPDSAAAVLGLRWHRGAIAISKASPPPWPNDTEDMKGSTVPLALAASAFPEVLRQSLDSILARYGLVEYDQKTFDKKHSLLWKELAQLLTSDLTWRWRSQTYGCTALDWAIIITFIREGPTCSWSATTLLRTTELL